MVDEIDNPDISEENKGQVEKQSQRNDAPKTSDVPKTDWSTKIEDTMDNDEYLTSGYDHKFWMAKTKVPKKLLNVRLTLQKELALSRITPAQAVILSTYLTCVQEYITAGFYDVANESFSRLLGKLQLYRSINGFERINQNESIAPHMRFDMSDEDIAAVNQMPDEEPPRGPSMISKLISSTSSRNRRRGR